jgi:non-specific serine/threonine protein kinase
MRARMLATVDWTLALAPEQRPQSVLAVRRALSGEMLPPPPSPRQLGSPAVAESTPAPLLVERAERAQNAAPARRWFSRLAATFWGPDGDPEPKPSTSRRRAHVSAAVTLALMGVVALGWGAWTLNRPSPLHAGHGNRAGETTTASSTRSATAQPSAMPASVTVTPVRLAGSQAAPTSVTDASAATDAEMSPVRLPMSSSDTDPVAPWIPPAGQQSTRFESGVAADAAPIARPPAAASPVSPQAARSAARDRHRPTGPRLQAASAAATSSRAATSACDGSGLFARAWCALNPCKGPHGHANPQCMERLRAEAARQQRVERQ